MKTTLYKIYLFCALLALSGNVFAGACDATSPEEIAKLFGVEAATVTEEVTRQRKTTSECLWTFSDAEGYGVSMTYRTFDKTDKITNPNFFKNNQQRFIDKGNKVGNWEIKYNSLELPNTEYGVMSDVYGNRFVRMRHYIWVKGEQRRLGVTFGFTANEQGSTKEPSADDIKKAVAIFTD